ncbi:MAG: HAD family hydrolase [Fidelibacterota bacterium]
MRDVKSVIYFDIGGVLLSIHPDRTLHYLRRCTSLPETVLGGALGGDIHDAYETGKLSDDEFYERYRATLPQPNGLTRKDFYEAWLRLIGEPTETLELARALARSYPVWLVSNTNPHHIRHGDARGYFRGFAGAIYSFEIGFRKPSKGFFGTALKRAGTLASSSIFVDDQFENIQAAQDLGFQTVHYRSHTQLRRDLDELLSPV